MPVLPRALQKKISSPIVLYLFLFLLAYGWLSSGIFREPFIYDEGISAYGAMRVLNGEIPYRDFWTMYGPGQFYLLSLLFRVTGFSLFAGRMLDIFIRALIPLAALKIMRSYSSWSIALCGWFLLLIWFSFFNYYIYPTYAALLFSLLALKDISFCLLKKPSKYCLFKGGLWSSAVLIFRHDLFIALLVSTFIILLLQGLQDTPFESRREKFLRTWKVLFHYTVIPLTIGVIYLTILLIKVPKELLLEQMIVFPLQVFPRVRSLPYPFFPGIISLYYGLIEPGVYLIYACRQIIYYLPIIVYSSILLLLGKSKIDMKVRSLIFFLFFWGLFTFNQALVRSDGPHFLPTLVPSIMLFCFLFQYCLVLKRSRKKIILLSLIIILFCMNSFYPLFIRLQYFRSPLRYGFFPASHDIPSAQRIHLERDQLEAVHYIRQNTDQNDRIFVGNTVHDPIFINDIMFYFLAERHASTMYYELHPGLVNTLPVQTKIIQDLQKDPTEWIVLREFDENIEPNESAIPTGINTLDIYIQDQYSPVESFGRYTIYRRNKLP